jgi:hypothetical protein
MHAHPLPHVFFSQITIVKLYVLAHHVLMFPQCIFLYKVRSQELGVKMLMGPHPPRLFVFVFYFVCLSTW